MTLSVLWAVAPAVPALVRGGLPGHGWTDLYPSVWGLDVFCAALPGWATHTPRFGAPEGIDFAYSSPLHGLAGWPVWAAWGPVAAYVVTLVAARAATVAVAYGALRALDRPHVGSVAGALIYGASPFFHGYAVEGIVEGTDGWTLPLWVWAVAARRPAFAGVAFALCVASSWYLGMVVCLGALGWGFRDRLAWGSAVGGLALASPLLFAFVGAFGGNSPLDPAVRVAMGAPLAVREPGVLAGVQPFALTTWVGVSLPLLGLLAARRAPVLAAGALLCWVLSTGRGPWWDLPIFELVRFPYRWHAGTLWCVAAVVSTLELRWRAALFVPFVEGLLLSPIEPVLPTASVDVPALYLQVEPAPLLELPGPVALPPGTPNPSRPRARYLLLAQLQHGAPSPWTLDFNGIAHSRDAAWLATFRAWDPVLDGAGPPPDLAAAAADGVHQAMVHRDEYRKVAPAFEAALAEAGARLVAEEGELALYRW